MSHPTVELLAGDCLEVLRSLPDSSADAFVMDPPYCSGGFSESGKRKAKGMTWQSKQADGEWFRGDNMGTAGLVWLLREVCVQAYRILKSGGSVLCFTDWRMIPSLAPALESSGLRYQNQVTWAKRLGPGTGFRASKEEILHLVKGVGKYHAVDVGNVIHAGGVHSSKRIHPTEKPVDLLRELIRVVAPVGGLVVDPFAGSASSGVAALEQGVSWVGIEVDDELRRRAEERLQLVTAAARGDQVDLFA